MPHSDLTDGLRKALLVPETNIRVVAATGIKIKHFVSRKVKVTKNYMSIIYEIPCSEWDNRYYGESGSGLKAKLKEHIDVLKYHL